MVVTGEMNARKKKMRKCVYDVGGETTWAGGIGLSFGGDDELT